MSEDIKDLEEAVKLLYEESKDKVSLQILNKLYHNHPSKVSSKDIVGAEGKDVMYQKYYKKAVALLDLTAEGLVKSHWDGIKPSYSLTESTYNIMDRIHKIVDAK